MTDVDKTVSILDSLRDESPELFRKTIQFSDTVVVPVPTKRQLEEISARKDRETAVRELFGPIFAEVDKAVEDLPARAAHRAVGALIDELRVNMPNADVVSDIDGSLKERFAEKFGTKE